MECWKLELLVRERMQIASASLGRGRADEQEYKPWVPSVEGVTSATLGVASCVAREGLRVWPPRSPYIGHSIDKAPNDRRDGVISIKVRRISPRARLGQGSVMGEAQLSVHVRASNYTGIS